MGKRRFDLGMRLCERKVRGGSAMNKPENTIQQVKVTDVKTPKVPRLVAGVSFNTASAAKKAVSTRWRG
jgi:hypothetical protein